MDKIKELLVLLGFHIEWVFEEVSYVQYRYLKNHNNILVGLNYSNKTILLELNYCLKKTHNENEAIEYLKNISIFKHILRKHKIDKLLNNG